MVKKVSRENEVLEFIQSFLDENGFPPSVREIGSACHMSSTATVYYYLEKLEAQGLLRKSPSKNRAIELIRDNSINPINTKNAVPFVGKITAGTPILATECIEDYINIPTQLFNNQDELFILQVKGDSMIEAGIFDGDMIIVKKQDYAYNGDIVAAMIDNSATVKRFYKEKNCYRLKPENTLMDDIIVDEVSILGLVVGLIRKMH